MIRRLTEIGRFDGHECGETKVMRISGQPLPLHIMLD